MCIYDKSGLCDQAKAHNLVAVVKTVDSAQADLERKMRNASLASRISPVE